MADNFLAIRIHPDSPVDGATFSTYLDDQVFLAGTGTLPGTTTLLSETKLTSTGLNLVNVPWIPDTYVASVSKRVAAPTTGSSSDFGKSLQVQDAAGIAFGSVATCPADSKMFASNTSVTSIPVASSPGALTLTLNQTIAKFAAEDTLVTFYFAYGSGSADSNAPPINPTWTGSDPSFQFDLKVKGAVTNSPTVKFDHSDGIAVGMTMSAVSGVLANIKVIAVPDGASITLSNNVSLADNATVTFQSSSSSGIIQHVEPVATGDTIERLFQVFSMAEQAGSIADSEGFNAQGAPSATSLRFRPRAASQRWCLLPGVPVGYVVREEPEDPQEA